MPNPQASRLPAQYSSYDDMQGAAIAALRGISEKHVESGGGILYNPATKKYAFTSPVGQLDDAHFSATVGVPQGWQLKGLYHTHPQGVESTKFSSDDVAQAKQLGVQSYILARYDDRIRLFDPVTSPITRSAGAYSSLGSLVDESPPSPAPAPP